MEENWNPIGSCYEVSRQGRVRNTKTGKILKPRPTKTGYLRVHIAISGKRKDYYIHRLVAEAFCDHPAGCDVINHLDNNPQNNNVENLEWTTQLMNVHYGMKQKRYRLNAVPVVGRKDGKEFCFISSHMAAKETGCNHSSIIRCCKGKMHSTKGYRWNYAEVAV